MDQRRRDIYRRIDKHIRSTRKSGYSVKKRFYLVSDKIKNKISGLGIQKSAQIKKLGEEVEIDNITPEKEQVKEEVEEEFKEVEKEEKTAKKGLFAKIASFFSKKESEEEVQIEPEKAEPKAEVTGTEQDLKDVMKIYLNLVQRLSPPMIERYKDSDDFKKFKELLKKYDVKKL